MKQRQTMKLKDRIAELEQTKVPVGPIDDEDSLDSDLNRNEERLRRAFTNCSDIVFRQIEIAEQLTALLVYVDGLINTPLLDQVFLKPLLLDDNPDDSEKVFRIRETIKTHALAVAQIDVKESVTGVIRAVLSANAAILISGVAQSLILHLESPPQRAIEEPTTETVIRGPREGMTEDLRVNTALLRKKLKTPRLKVETMTLGDISNTDVALVFIEGIVNDKILEEVRRRVSSIEIDAILESGYIEEFIEDAPFSPFPTVQNTERPDVVVANLLEGKVGILADGTPFALVVPLTFWGSLQSAEDYYERYFYTTPMRWLRVFFTGVALFFPSLYVAATTFHPQLIPTNLVLTFAAARESSPFPAVVEALIMEVIFEVLREASIRLPQNIGTSVSIVGGLVIGEAAVQAGIISAPMVIVVATTGIASFAIPRYNFALAFRILRFPILILAGSLGFFGITVGMITLLIHLVSLRSFGVPYLSPVAPMDPSHLGDAILRLPRWTMHTRHPLISNWRHPNRIPKGQRPSPTKAR